MIETRQVPDEIRRAAAAEPVALELRRVGAARQRHQVERETVGAGEVEPHRLRPAPLPQPRRPRAAGGDVELRLLEALGQREERVADLLGGRVGAELQRAAEQLDALDELLRADLRGEDAEIRQRDCGTGAPRVAPYACAHAHGQRSHSWHTFWPLGRDTCAVQWLNKESIDA